MNAHSTPLDLDSVIREFTPLVTRLARQVAARVPANVTFDDLVQSGLIGLVDAAQRFDASLGTPLEGFVRPRIRGAMMDELRSHDWTPRRQRQMSRRIDEAASRAAQRLGRAATRLELADEMGLDVEALEQLAAAGSASSVGSYDSADSEGDDEAFIERNFADPNADPAAELANKRFREDLARNIGKLPEREKLVMGLYYEQELNLREIAAVIGVTESRICQIHREAIARLRTNLEGWTQHERAA